MADLDAVHLNDASMCPVCFYDVGTFKYCCDTGKSHGPLYCEDCRVDFTDGSIISKFCTVSGRPHRDAKTRDVTAADLIQSTCPFCSYEKSVHQWCTETGWEHADLDGSYSRYKSGKRTLTSTPPLDGMVAKRVKTLAGTPPKPVVITTASASPVPTPLANGHSAFASITASSSPVPSQPVPRPVLAQPVLPRQHITDGSFLMSGVTASMKILFCGEGNFSFSRTIGKRVFADGQWGNMLATDLVLLAGPNNPGHQFTTANTLELIRQGASVKVGVDATKIHENLPLVQAGTFDLMTFQFPHNADKNFPYYPYPKGLPLDSVGSHREMLSGFLRQAAIMLREGGRACITTKTSEPYKSWEIDTLAESPMWFMKGEVFDTGRWAQLGYTHINTVNKCQTSIEGALTYIFTKDSAGVAEAHAGRDYYHDDSQYEPPPE